MAHNVEKEIDGVIRTVTELDHTAQEIDDAVEAAKKALPRDGSGVMTGALIMDTNGGNGQSYLAVSGEPYPHVYLNVFEKSDRKRRRTLMLSSRQNSPDIASALVLASLDDGTWRDYPVLHTGNKPSGSYTGNGDATERVIPIGGIGEAVLVVGGRSAVIVTSAGAFGGAYDGQPKCFADYQCSAPQNGSLVIRSADNGLNGNGLEYKYYRL